LASWTGCPIASTLPGEMTITKQPIKRCAAASVILLLGFATGCSTGRPAALTPCYRDTVQTSPGVILPLSSGLVYQVYPTDNHVSMTWLPLDKLIVCPIGGSAVEMTNISEKGEKVRALRLYNWAWYVWPYS
jgi:hypothetical protein